MMSAAAIVRAYIMYKPYVIFGWISAFLGILGLTPFVRYAVLLSMGEPGGGHVQSLLIGAVLLVLSFLCVMLGIVSDLIRTNRTLIEATLEHTKRSRFVKSAYVADATARLHAVPRPGDPPDSRQIVG
jgi:hypothetical protein